MKLRHIQIIILFILSFGTSYSQIETSFLKQHWLYLKSTDSDINNPIMDFYYNKIHFETQKLVSVYPKIVINGISKITYDYKVENDSLTIFAGYNTLKYYIDTVTSDSLVLTKGNKYYVFISYLPIDENKIIIKDDTIESFKFKAPKFKGDLYRYIMKNQIYFENSGRTFNVDINYSVFKNGSIGDINIDSEDSVLKVSIRKVIKNAEGKWKPGKIKNEKRKLSINHKFVVPNKEIVFNKINNPRNRAKKLFKKGYDYYSNNDVDSSFLYYSSCSSFCEFIFSIEPYMNKYYDIYSLWINSTMNLAIIYLENGARNKACDELNKLLFHDQQANRVYNEHCRNCE